MVLFRKSVTCHVFSEYELFEAGGFENELDGLGVFVAVIMVGLGGVNGRAEVGGESGEVVIGEV